MRSILLTCLFAAACSPSGSDSNDTATVPEPTPIANPSLTQASDCEALRATVLDSVTEAVLHARYGGIRIDDKLGGKSDDTQLPASETVELESEPPPVEAEDLVKVVGNRLFVMSDDQMQIVNLEDAGQLSDGGYLGIGQGLTAEGMFADENAAILFHSIDEESDGADFAGTRVTVVDVSHPMKPEVTRQFDIEGDFEMARRQGDFVNLVTSSRWRVDAAIWDIAYGDSPTLPRPEPNSNEVRQAELRDAARSDVRSRVDALLTDADSIIPRLRAEATAAAPLLACNHVWGSTPASSVRLTTMTRFDASAELSSFAVIGDDFSGAMADDGAMFAVFADRWGPFAGTSLLHQFAADSYRDTLQIEGRIVDEFSLDAQRDSVNIITVSDGTPALHAFPRNGDELGEETTTKLEDAGLVVANRITSTTAFIATHGDTEQIFALPLGSSDASGPFEVGGIPTMIHTLDGDRILVVAQKTDADDNQVGVRLEIFDADASPDSSVSVSTGEFAAWSEAMWEPRSLAYSPDGVVAFPVNIEAWADAGAQNFSGVLVYGTDGSVERRAAIDHSDLSRIARCRAGDQPDDCAAPAGSPWWTHVRRSVFVGTTLVTVSEAGVKAHSTADFSELSSLVFD